jgi:predicted peptidase
MLNVMLLCGLTILPTICIAQSDSQYLKQVFKNDDGEMLNYRLLPPKTVTKDQKYPLVVFLHGAGERGSDNEKQLVHGSSLFLKEDFRNQFPAYVIFPQCPAEGYWSSVDINRSSTPLKLTFDYSKPMTQSLRLVMELIKEMKASSSVDPNRIYIIGLSMGGMGTFEIVHRFPKVFAAALPICGGADAKRYSKKTSRVPFWVFHGETDNVVDVALSREMVQKLTSLKATVKYSEYPGVGHNSWDNAFAEPTLLSWMFSQHK